MGANIGKYVILDDKSVYKITAMNQNGYYTLYNSELNISITIHNTEINKIHTIKPKQNSNLSILSKNRNKAINDITAQLHVLQLISDKNQEILKQEKMLNEILKNLSSSDLSVIQKTIDDMNPVGVKKNLDVSTPESITTQTQDNQD